MKDHTETLESMPWIPINAATKLIKKIKGLDWVCDFSMKYVSIRIDTRDLRCVIMDRHNNVISKDKYESYKNGTNSTFKKRSNIK